MKPLKADELRKKFIDFFVSKGHTQISGASVIPENDRAVCRCQQVAADPGEHHGHDVAHGHALHVDAALVDVVLPLHLPDEGLDELDVVVVLGDPPVGGLGEDVRWRRRNTPPS